MSPAAKETNNQKVKEDKTNGEASPYTKTQDPSSAQQNIPDMPNNSSQHPELVRDRSLP